MPPVTLQEQQWAVQQVRRHLEQQAGQERPAECAFRLLDERRYGFTIGDYPDGDALVVDPPLVWSTFLGDQWSIGAWDAMREGSADHLPEHLKFFPVPDEPPQRLKEYDPEWGRSFWSGTVAASP